MVNPIKYLALEADVSLLKLAELADVDNNTVYALSRAGDELPDTVQLGTLRKIAEAIGKRVVISFVDVQSENNL